MSQESVVEQIFCDADVRAQIERAQSAEECDAILQRYGIGMTAAELRSQPATRMRVAIR